MFNLSHLEHFLKTIKRTDDSEQHTSSINFKHANSKLWSPLFHNDSTIMEIQEEMFVNYKCPLTTDI